LRVFRLHAGQFIHADRPLASFGTLGCSGRELAAPNDFLFPLRVCDFCQPLPETVRLPSPYFSHIGSMSGRDLFNDAPLLQFGSSFSSSPLTDRASCLHRRFTGQSGNLAALLDSHSSWSSWSGRILQTLGDAERLPVNALQFSPAITP
jgi:hypothetical protein